MSLSEPLRVLFVCTGNVCRSPFAEILARHLFAAHGLPAEVSSAGTNPPVGAPLHRDMRRALAGWGLDGGPAEVCRARLLEVGMVASADLVLGATVEHRAAIVRTAPKGLRHTFALREFARLVVGLDPDLLPTDPAQRGRALVAAARAQRGARPVAPGEDDIADPIGRPAAAHLEAAGSIADALVAITAALVGITPAQVRASALSAR
jgi:protein-tyrosine phosphatase